MDESLGQPTGRNLHAQWVLSWTYEHAPLRRTVHASRCPSRCPSRSSLNTRPQSLSASRHLVLARGYFSPPMSCARWLPLGSSHLPPVTRTPSASPTPHTGRMYPRTLPAARFAHRPRHAKRHVCVVGQVLLSNAHRPPHAARQPRPVVRAPWVAGFSYVAAAR
ncbi:hypothetical protein GGX14DRAFT_564247 [Mycena pura]|uniref:Uncharacterized protein n=1 Tax=Mycena pura TaxID=153505 RepID=A0AAD6VGS7_9AGAR|nr:hypothetical protein GGX14DRAFT_564247 [Mycena pura]